MQDAISMYQAAAVWSPFFRSLLESRRLGPPVEQR
jgi:hypothetical protein